MCARVVWAMCFVLCVCVCVCVRVCVYASVYVYAYLPHTPVRCPRHSKLKRSDRGWNIHVSPFEVALMFNS